MKWWVLLVILLLAPSAEAARLYGAIYDKDLEPISKTVVYINTSPMQRHISKFGGYSFEVPAGSYIVSANLTINNITRQIAQENVFVSGDGEYRIDLFINDSINLTHAFTPQPRDVPVLNYVLIAGGIILGIILLVGIIVWHQNEILTLLRRRHQEEQQVSGQQTQHEDIQKEEQKQPTLVDPLEEKIYQMLLVAKQMQQKDIRKQLKFSEAKVSLAISSLENKGLVEKVRDGRSNSIKLVQSQNLKG